MFKLKFQLKDGLKGETSWFWPRAAILYGKQVLFVEVTWLILSLQIIVLVFIFTVINKASIHEHEHDCLLRNLLLCLKQDIFNRCNVAIITE